MAYSDDQRNFSDNRIVPAVPVLFSPRLSPSAEAVVSLFEKGKLAPKTAWDCTLEEYKDQAEQRGNELIMIEVSKAASPSTVVDELERWIKAHPSSMIGYDGKAAFRMRPDKMELIASLDRNRDLGPAEI